MARTNKPEAGTVELPKLGEEGETCATCGEVLATDQRYCLNCGARRGGTRTDYEGDLTKNGAQPQLNGAPAAGAAGGASAVRDWSPITVIGSIAVLGVMLLLGVLIGK